MMGYKKVPSLRFKGFTDNWNRCKLGELTDFVTGKSFTSELSDDGNYIVMDMGAVSQEGMRIETKNTNVKRDVLKKDDLIMPKDDIGGGLIIGRTAYIPSNERYVLGDHVYRLRFLKENGLFVHYQINSECIRKTIIPLVTGSAQLGLNSKNIQGVDISIPSIDEQKKIGSYFNDIVNLITLHQQKYDKLLNVKRAMLEKLFPKEGETIPKIRFKGFTGSWAWHKVTELGEIYIGLVTTMTSHYTDHGALLIRNSDIKDGYFDFGINPIFLDDDFAKQNSLRKHRIGDVITVHTGDIGTSAVVTEKEAGSLGFATIVTRPNNNIITSYYLCTYLNTDTHKNFAMNISTGDGRNNYNLKDYYQCIIPVPSIKEQERISAYFQNINNLINLQQRKIEKLKNIKKAMLEKMFV